MRHLIFNFLTLLLLISNAFADILKDDVLDVGYEFTAYNINYVLDKDASSTVETNMTVKILNSDGLEDIKSWQESYSTSATEFEMISAYTQKPNGEKINVPKENFQVEINKGLEDKSSPAFSDFTTYSFVFPQLEVGDSVYVAYKTKTKQQYFKEEFSSADYFYESMLYRKATISLQFPESLKLNFKAYKLQELKNVIENGIHHLQWSYTNLKPKESDATGSDVYVMGADPTLHISTFENYKEIAEAYGIHAKNKAIVSNRIKELANKIVGDTRDRKETAKKLFDWVRKEISYAGNCIGVGAVVPRDLDFVLDNKMGDCKDHATLLQALLNSKEIENTQALIGVNSLYDLPELPIVESVNHVINYIPEFDLYLDSTNPYAIFDLLPSTISARRVLHVDNYIENRRTPFSTLQSSSNKTSTKMTILDDGSVQGVAEVEYIEISAMGVLEKYKKYTEKKKEELQKELLEHYRMKGDLNITYDFPENNEKYVKIRYDFKLKNFLPMENAGAMPVFPLFIKPVIYLLAQNALQSDDNNSPTSRFWCTGAAADESYQITFPKNLKILSAPKDMTIKNDYIQLESKYKIDKNTLSATKYYRDVTPGPVCEPEVWKQYHEAAKEVMKDVKSQVVYQNVEENMQ